MNSANRDQRTRAMFKLTNRAYTMMEQQRLRTAKGLLEEALKQYPENTAYISYKLGALNQWEIGDGEEAHRLFKLTVEHCNQGGVIGSSELKEFEANACENLMLLSLSYEEYDVWADRLEQLQPENAILHQQKPMFHNLRDRGYPWARALQKMAISYYYPDPGWDPGPYGGAASTYQLLLKHRKELRLPRNEYSTVAHQYGIILNNLITKRAIKMVQFFGGSDPAEFKFVVELGLPLLEEYLKAFPQDEKVLEQLEMLRKCLTIPATIKLPTTGQEESTDQRTPRPEMVWWPYLCGAAIGGLLVYYVSPQSPPFWLWFIGCLGGLIFVSLILKARDKKWLVVSSEINWQTNDSLKQAIAAAGVDGLQFQLVKVEVNPDGDLELRFRSLGMVPVGKERKAGLALRSVVGLTLPLVATSVRDIQVLNQPSLYGVSLGRGVAMPDIMLRFGAYQTGFLRVTSREANGVWYVGVESMRVSVENYWAQLQIQHQIFQKLVPAFEELKQQPIVLET